MHALWYPFCRQFLLRRSLPGTVHSRPPLATLPAPSGASQRLSGTVSTSAGTVLLESDDLASLDRAIVAQHILPPQLARPLPANLFAEAESDDEDDEEAEAEEQLSAFLEHGTDSLRALGRRFDDNNNLSALSQSTQAPRAVSDSPPPPKHPLVSVV